jgi:succinyl-diaminopimelate desuccinylase
MAAVDEIPDVVVLTQQLVRLRSVNDPAGGSCEAPVADEVAALMRSFGWQVEIDDVAAGRPNVIAVIDGTSPGPTLMFAGHTDVVSEGDHDGWTVDPFGGEIVDGRLYGRGSADMKSGVAAMICAARKVQLSGPFAGRLVVAALVDEEGLMLGAKHFAGTELAATVDAAVVCEPEAGEICLSAKGAVRFSIELFGAMAHGAMPHQARNPILVIGPLLAALADYQVELQQQYPQDEYLGEVYVTPTVVQAGDPDQINVIPAYAQVCLDVRTIVGVDHAGLIQHVSELAERVAASLDVEAMTRVIDDRPAVAIEQDHPLVRAIAAAHEAVTGEPARYGGVPGATDGTILFRDAAIANVVYGPGGKWIAHQADEFVEVSDIHAAVEVYYETACRFLLAGTEG